MDKRTYQRMVAELRQLDRRIDKLTVFKFTETYAKLSKQEKIWLNEQLNAMKWYYSSLKSRVLYYHDKEVLKNGGSFTENPAE